MGLVGDVNFNIATLVLGALAVSCAVLSGLFMTQEIGEINRKLPEHQQFSYWGMYSEKYMAIRQEYKRFYPNGRIHAAGIAAEIAAFVFFLLALVAGGFLR